MRWLVDECVNAALVADLRDSGHDVIYMSDADPRADDVEVMRRAHHDLRLLLTEDKDFGDLVFRQALPVHNPAAYRSSSADSQTRATAGCCREVWGSVIRTLYSH